MDILVFGAGSLGSLVGGLLAREHDVTLVARAPHATAVRERGLRVGGAFDVTVHPDARTDVPPSADLAVVTVKAFDTPAAADALARVELDACLTLSNGMGNEETLAAALPCPVLAGTATYGAMLTEPGVVACTGVGEIVLGAPEGGPSPVADEVGAAFSQAGIVTEVAADMPRRLWEKLAVNAGINATTALARVENGALLSGAANRVATAAGREVARVARAEGVELSDEAAVEAVEAVTEATAKNTSSMHQDVLDGRRTEVDAISGYAVARAAAHGLSVPVNATMADLLRAWEAARGLR
jgi:2-dehydropantoate 2-reductase